MSDYKYHTLLLEHPEPGIARITFNRPHIKNAMDAESFFEWGHAIRASNRNPDVRVIIVRGCVESGIFTAGARLGSGSDRPLTGEAAQMESTLQFMIDETIDSKKPLVAAVLGPGIGIGATILGLFDFVYCSPDTVFRTPFMPLALGAEGCSSLTFESRMGPKLAYQLLYLDRTLPASQFVSCGWVTEILPREGFHEKVMETARELAGMPPVALEATRELVIKTRYGGRAALKEANRLEIENLAKVGADPRNQSSRERYVSNLLNKSKKPKM